MTDRVDLARHHAFEVSVWRERGDYADFTKGWHWSVRLAGATVAQSDERRHCDSAAAAFSEGTKRLLEILKTRSSTAAADFHLVATGLGENPPPSGF